MGRPVAHAVDTNVFSKITDDAAYWIGFLMADGTIYKRREGHQSHIKLSLHEKDKQHLEKWQRFLSTKSPITFYTTNAGKTPVAELVICSEQIAQDLQKYGVTTRKSMTATVSSLEHNRHFWRGVIDGDGWIGLPTRKGVELVGARPLLTQFCAWCGQFNLGPLPKPTVHKTIFRVRLPQRYVVPVLSELYQHGDTCLQRKYDRAQLLLPYHNFSNSVKPSR